MQTDWGFSHPLLLWALLLLPLFALDRWRLSRRDRIPYPPLQLEHGRRGRRWAAWLAPLVQLVMLAVLVLGAAGPYRRVAVELIEEDGIDVLLVLDVSLSMLAEDVVPNRIEALRDVARDFIVRSGGHRLGVLVFAKDVYVQSPLTTDRESLLSLLDSVTVYTMSTSKSGGTAVGDALLMGTEHLRASRVEGRDQVMVLITDGESNEGIEPRLAARHAWDQEVRIYAVGIGGTTPVSVTFEGGPVGSDGSPYLAVLDEAELRAVAAAADGRFFRAVDDDTLGQIFAELSRLESAPLEARTVEVRSALSGWLALVALPLFTVVLVLGGVVLRRPLR